MEYRTKVIISIVSVFVVIGIFLALFFTLKKQNQIYVKN